MRILVDYRPALRDRTGVGEYIHQLVRAYAAAHPNEVAVFTSSWKDRPGVSLAEQLGARVIDRRVPVRVLNYLWHRAGWPPVEALAGDCDVVHSAHPLLIPARRAAQVVTVHDLFFLSHPERMRNEIRRDYPRLASAHARRADAIVTSTQYGRRLVVDRLGADAERVYVCPPGAPEWRSLGSSPNVPADGHVLFVGTLEARKNIGTLLDAYSLLRQRRPSAPPLVLAGRASPDAADWLQRIEQPPLVGHVKLRGYVSEEDRERLFANARVLVLPSLDEGFGFPALEAMSAGVPLVTSDRGSLPEVVADGGMLVNPTDIEGLAAAMERVIADDDVARAWGLAGLARARAFTWADSARTLRRAYTEAMARRERRTE